MSTSETPRILGVFAKQPLPGKVKTRIASALSPDFAARLAEALLRDTLLRLSAIPARRVLAFAPRSAKASFEGFTKGMFELLPQGTGDLGERMAQFFRSHLAEADRVILVGSDSPTLPLEYVERAFDALGNADVVLGPATDGGYYLIGCRGSVPESLFQGIDWGESTVLFHTVLGLPLECKLDLLPPWYDIDTWQDLIVMKGHVAALRRAGKDPCVPNVSALLDW